MMLMVPRVTTMGGIFSLAMSRPLHRPIRVPLTHAITMVTNRLEVQDIREWPVITVTAAIIDAADTSIPPLSITRSIPRAMIVSTRLLLRISMKFSKVKKAGFTTPIITESSTRISRIGSSFTFSGSFLIAASFNPGVPA